MGAMPATQHMTAEEFLRLPDTDDLRNVTLTSPQLDRFELALAEPFPE
jgi:hypothetical protein